MTQQTLGQDLLAKGGIAPETFQAQGNKVKLGGVQVGKFLHGNEAATFLVRSQVKKFQG